MYASANDAYMMSVTRMTGSDDESRGTVSFQGEHGAYSEQAAQSYFGESVHTEPCNTIKGVFTAVERGSSFFGVVPAENSLEGSVNQTYDLLLESSLTIYAEIKIKITHCLLALPGTKLADVRAVYSHPQALAQCSAFLESLHVVGEPTYDTAGSARLLKEKDLHDAAAIASKKAASLYGLDILQERIEDFSENFTRFLVIAKKEAERTGRDKTSIVFATKHTPGSLQRALSELSTRGINLTKIESRPIRAIPWEYHFFVDFEGHRTDRECVNALEALGKATASLKILGSYPRATT